MLLINLSTILPFLQLVSTFPTSRTTSLEERATPDWQYYFGVDATAHKSRSNDLKSKGYRLISLSTSGGTTSTQYAAIWVQREGPQFETIHDVDQSEYQIWFNKNKADGYVPTQVSVVGQGNATLFAGVMEKSNVTDWTQECDLDPNRFEGYDQRGRSMVQSLKSFTRYGSPSDPRFCAIWHANSALAKWNRSPLASKTDFKTRLNSETSKPYWHPSFLEITDDSEYAAIFTENSIGPWSAHYGLTADELEAETETQRAAGKNMIQLSAGGSANGTLYAALYAASDIPLARTWRVEGEATTGFKDTAAAEKKIEQTIQDFMQKTGARQIQVSMRKGDDQLYNKAFTWSEMDRPTTHINDTFLLASVTKAFAAAAITSLYDSGKLTPDTKVYPLLGYKNGTAPDPRQLDVTVQHLVDHQGGTSRTVTQDPAFDMRTIALQINGGAHPLTLTEFVDYMYNQQLDFTPGETSDYSNYGYVLLSYLVQNVTGVPYFDYIQESIIKPEGLNVKQWLTNSNAHKNDNIIQESQNTGLSALEPLNPNRVANIFGGDGQYKETLVGTTGLAASAESMAKFLRKHSAWGTGARGELGGTRSGTVDGARTFIEANAYGIDWAMNINTRDFPNADGDFEDLVSSMSQWLYSRPELE